MQRASNRLFNQIRPLSFVYNVFEFSAGSVFFEMGKTKILCAVSLNTGVPPFLRGSNTGWLKASYSMLPLSTQQRTERESNQKRNDRSVEITRLIGRSLRTVCALENLGERTIFVDCDVLQADGGTRTACITAAGLALGKAQETWLSRGIISESIMRDAIAGISVGVAEDNALLLDLDCAEDNKTMADFNFIMTKAGRIVEIQGTAEKQPLSWDSIQEMKILADSGIEQIFKTIDEKNQDATQEKVMLMAQRFKQRTL